MTALPYRRLLLIIPLLGTLLALAACGGSKSSTSAGTTSTTGTTTSSAPVAVTGRSTSVILNPKTAATLKAKQITVAPLAPATGTASIAFPVTGGSVVVATLAGTVDHSGGLQFTHAGKTVQLTNFIIDTNAKQLTAMTGGQRVPVFALDLASIKKVSAPGGLVVASDIKLSLTSQAADALNSGLGGITVFKSGMPIGLATLKLAVKK